MLLPYLVASHMEGAQHATSASTIPKSGWLRAAARTANQTIVFLQFHAKWVRGQAVLGQHELDEMLSER
ncbi:MAG: hypothetical protein M3T55_12260 [Pseudomonadota bacterium]|nr:hypothetical protein [Pseudomonadota bacterium]